MNTEEIKKRGLAQYDKRLKEFEEFIRQSTQDHDLFQVFMRLKDMEPYGKRFRIGDMFDNSLVQKDLRLNVRTILSGADWLLMPKAIKAACSDIWYQIEDDGHLELVRVQAHDELSLTGSAYHNEVVYLLSTEVMSQLWMHRTNTAAMALKDMGGWVNCVIDKVDSKSFKSYSSFVAFADELAHEENFDENGFIIPKRIDKIMFPEVVS